MAVNVFCAKQLLLNLYLEDDCVSTHQLKLDKLNVALSTGVSSKEARDHIPGFVSTPKDCSGTETARKYQAAVSHVRILAFIWFSNIALVWLYVQGFGSCKDVAKGQNSELCPF